MAATLVLNDIEIVTRIVSCVAELAGCEHRNKTLIACTTVSKSFHKQAIEHIWYKLDTVQPILQLLLAVPLSQQAVGDGVENDESSETWSNVTKYTSLIHEMYSIDRRAAVWDSQASVDAFNRLVLEAKQRSIRLFPNLRRLGQAPSNMNPAPLLQGSITDLYIGQYYVTDPEHPHDAVRPLTQSSNLRFLWIGINAPTLLRDSLIFVHTLERLVVEDPDICTLELLQGIQVLPRLASLSLVINRMLAHPHQRVTLNFPLLRTLKVEGTWSKLIQLMRTGIRPLSNLRLDIHLQSKTVDVTPGSQLQMVLAHLDPGMLGGLETLELYVRGAENGVIGDNRNHHEILNPICHCSNLNRLTLATPISTDAISDHLLTTISSLPVLEYLDICGPGSNGSSIEAFTPAFLVRLAQRSTSLRHLEIIIAKDWSTLNVPTDGFESSSRIEAIQFGPTEWDSTRGAVDVAGILRMLFPMLKSVEGEDSMWSQVDYLLQSSDADLGSGKIRTSAV